MQALDSLGRDHQMLRELAEALGAYVSALEAGQPRRDGDLKSWCRASGGDGVSSLRKGGGTARCPRSCVTASTTTT
jgi:hypothetical protein